MDFLVMQSAARSGVAGATPGGLHEAPSPSQKQ
jgi:hypothetical protein